MRKYTQWAVRIGIPLYLLLLVAQALTKAPFFDEFFVANPAYNLAFHGYPGTTGFEMATSAWKGVDRHTYNTLPTGILVLSLFYKLFGFSLFVTRLASLASGLTVLGIVYYLVLQFYPDRRVAALASFLLATNYTFILGAGFGRVDMLTAALGLGAQAVYLRYRKHSLNQGVLLSCTLMVLCGLTHPNGVVYFLCLLLMAWVFDGRRLLRPVTICVALIPFVIGGGAWLLYVMQSLPDATAQLATNANDHDALLGFRHPLQVLLLEIQERYLHGVFHHGGTEPNAAIRLKVVIFLAYVASVASTLMVPVLRRMNGSRLILGQLTIVFAWCWLLEGLKLPWYLLLSVPLYSALLANWLLYLWDRRSAPRYALIAFVIALVAVHVGGIVYRIYKNEYRNDYLPAARFLQQRAAPADLVFARCDFGFDYGFERNLIEDPNFGYITHKSPKFIVVSPTIEWGIAESERSNPPVYRHIQALLSTYKLVYQHGSYRIFENPT